MLVRKFEANSLEEVLKDIKRELGPDAIILKTVSNKGLKGAFKKSKIEITAAISEKSYTKKSKVDRVLSDEDKSRFYSSSANSMSETINQYDRPRGQASIPSYGKLGLNKSVQTTRGIEQKNVSLSDDLRSSFDNFISHNNNEKDPAEVESSIIKHEDVARNNIKISAKNQDLSHYHSSPNSPEMEEELIATKNKVDELERKIFELNQIVEKMNSNSGPRGVYHLRTILRSLEISEYFIQGLIKKITFDMTDEELNDHDKVFDYALREMLASVRTDLNLFSTRNNAEPVITVLLSEVSSGQTTMALKIASMKERTSVITKKMNEANKELSYDFTAKVFGLEVVEASSLAEVVSYCRKMSSDQKDIIIDYKVDAGDLNETKKFIDGVRRSFKNVEVLATLSAINSELYNRKVVERYASVLDGINVTHLDYCLDYGPLFNLNHDFSHIPFKLFSTGQQIPDNIETATPERVLAGIFKIET